MLILAGPGEVKSPAEGTGKSESSTSPLDVVILPFDRATRCGGDGAASGREASLVSALSDRNADNRVSNPRLRPPPAGGGDGESTLPSPSVEAGKALSLAGKASPRHLHRPRWINHLKVLNEAWRTASTGR